MKITTISAKRRRGLEFHIQSNDYFGSLATALFLLQESIERPGNEAMQEALRRSVWDLMYLQKHYRIIKMN
jgi:hypothetical protein